MFDFALYIFKSLSSCYDHVFHGHDLDSCASSGQMCAVILVTWHQIDSAAAAAAAAAAGVAAYSSWMPSYYPDEMDAHDLYAWIQ